jgi:hypothetical protein
MSEKEEKPKKPQISGEEKRRRQVAQVKELAGKLKHTASNHREAAYWEQLEEDLGKALTGPLE